MPRSLIFWTRTPVRTVLVTCIHINLRRIQGGVSIILMILQIRKNNLKLTENGATSKG